MRPTVALLLVISGCLGRDPYEGDEPNECFDQADNDRDGLFDCDDEGCQGSSACDEDTSDPDDRDGDGYTTDTDCDDADPDVHPDATEVRWDGKDNDCDAATLDDDIDQDGVGVADDCDENDASVGSDAAGECLNRCVAQVRVTTGQRDAGLGSAVAWVDGVGLAVGAASNDDWAGALYLFDSSAVVTGAVLLAETDAQAAWAGSSDYEKLGATGTLAAVPDLDGDGAAELLAATPYSDPSGLSNLGEVFVLLSGERSAWSVGATVRDEAGIVFLGRNTADLFGVSTTTADLDGDGTTDLVVTSTQDDTGYQNAGAVYLFYAMGTLGPTVSASDADCALHGGFFEYLGKGQLFAGQDFNLDGTNDLVVGSTEGDTDAAELAGEVFLVDGADLVSGAMDEVAYAVVGGGSYDDGMGSSVVGMGDLDGDSGADLVVGATSGDAFTTDGGTLALFHGGVDLWGTWDLQDATTVWGGPITLSLVGSVALARDLDLDGATDLLAAAPYLAEGGRAYGLARARAPWSGGTLDDDADLWVSSFEPDGLGTALDAADIDGKGVADIVAGAPDSGDKLGGDAFVFLR